MKKNTLMEHYGSGVVHTADNIFKIIAPLSNFNLSVLWEYIKALKLILCAPKQNIAYVPGDQDIITEGTIIFNLLTLVKIKSIFHIIFHIYFIIFFIFFYFVIIIGTLLRKNVYWFHAFVSNS